MSTILIATDFSEVSCRARDFARELAQAMGSGLHLLHVIEPVDEPDSEDPETRAFYRKLEEQARQKLAAELETLKPLTVSSTVLVGPRYQAILDTAQDLDARMIVLGTHVIEDTTPAYLGVSHKVAWKTDRPVVLVP